jgi:poly(3-hydroxybutyrate) depolymerase
MESGSDRRMRRTSNVGGGLCRLIRGIGVALVAFGAALAPLGAEANGDGGSGQCRRPMTPGLYTVDVVQAGVHRPFQLWIPASYKGKPIPLLFWLHGSGTTGEQAMATADPNGRPIFQDHADATGYAVAAPSGAIPFNPAPGISGFAWNIPGVPLVGTTIYPPASTLDDVAYIGLAIDAVAQTICLDERRVYASGASGGGRMASQLACDLSDRIAAIAPVMGLRAPRISDSAGADGGMPAFAAGPRRHDPRTSRSGERVRRRRFAARPGLVVDLRPAGGPRALGAAERMPARRAAAQALLGPHRSRSAIAAASRARRSSSTTSSTGDTRCRAPRSCPSSCR